MAVYIWVESPGTTRQMKPRVAATKFGDGYEERAPDGLNPVKATWNVQHRGIDNDVADEIETFLLARFSAGLEAFDWTPLWATTALRFKCEEWSRVQDEDAHTCTITATFQQVFEP